MNDPRCADQVLRAEASLFDSDPHPYRALVGSFTPHAMLVLGIDGRQSNSALGADLGEDLAAAAAATAEDLVARSCGGFVPVSGPLHGLLLRFTTRMLFGVDVAGMAGSFVSAMRLLEECWANEFAPDPSMQPLHADYLHAVETMNETVDHISRATGQPTSPAVLLRTLLNGYHGTATALTWALWELARRPDVQGEVRAEVDLVCRGLTPTAADTRRLHLTRRVVLETLRLHPPAWNIGRTASGNYELGGARIPEGSYVSVSPYVMHRAPALWPRPDEFLPDRFLARPAARRLPCSFLPFGAGPRRCPAARYAIEHLQILLAVFVQLARLESADLPVRPRGLIGLRPDPDVFLRVAGCR